MDNQTLQKNGIPVRVSIADWIFGQPVLRYANNSTARWDRSTTSPLNQKGGTGWLACLHGGVQTGDDWAALYVPVNEVPVTKFDFAKWSYYLTSEQTMGVNIVIWVHDPSDFDKRAEITQLGGHADLEKAAGWNAFEFSKDTGGMFFYGENTTGTGLTAGTQYTWQQFQADALFKDWTIYRISIEYGWEASGTFDPAWVADLELNGVIIPLRPEQQPSVDAHSGKWRHPFGKGSLTTDGIQYSAEHTTTTDGYEAVETITFYNPPGLTIEDIEFGLTMAIKSSGAAESVLWKWQASDNGTDWEDLIAEQTRAADASTYADVTVSGRFAPTGNFLGTGNTFQVRAVIKSGGAGGETAKGKTKNSSYMYVSYRGA